MLGVPVNKVGHICDDPDSCQHTHAFRYYGFFRLSNRSGEIMLVFNRETTFKEDDLITEWFLQQTIIIPNIDCISLCRGKGYLFVCNKKRIKCQLDRQLQCCLIKD